MSPTDQGLDAVLKPCGMLKIELFDEHGNLKDYREVPNLITTAGKGHIAGRLDGTTTTASVNAMGWMEVGTTNTAANVADTALAAAVAASRTALTSHTASAATIPFVCTFGAGVGTGALVEAGVFNASSAGTMLCRSVFSTINKGASDSLTITWTVTIA